MDTEQQQQQQLETLLTAICDDGTLALVLPLATPGLLRIADADGKPPQWLVIARCNDVDVIQLLNILWPGALFAVANGELIVAFVQSLAGDYDEIDDLVCDC